MLGRFARVEVKDGQAVGGALIEGTSLRFNGKEVPR